MRSGAADGSASRSRQEKRRLPAVSAARAITATESDDHYVAAHGGAVSAYIAAMTALRVAGRERHDEERAWQADWLVRTLELV